jgi:hypothetical protein
LQARLDQPVPKAEIRHDARDRVREQIRPARRDEQAVVLGADDVAVDVVLRRAASSAAP